MEPSDGNLVHEEYIAASIIVTVVVSRSTGPHVSQNDETG